MVQSAKNNQGVGNIFRSLKYKNFRLFFSGQSISLIGTWIQRIATPWLVYHVSGSSLLLGAVAFAGQIPTFIIAPFAGVMTDRWNRYYILVGTQVAAMIQALLLAFLFYTGTIQIWHIVVLNMLLGVINAFDLPSRQSFMIEMVDNKNDLANAIALNSSMVNGARLLGPSIAGMLIAFRGEGMCFLINGLSYIFVISSLLLMKVTPRKLPLKNQKVINELKEGFNYAFKYLPIRYIILLLALVSLMGMSYTVLMPVYAQEILHGGSHTFGFLMGASGLGAFTGALFLASRSNVKDLIKFIPLAAAIFGIGLICFSLSRWFILSMVLMVVVGLGMMLQMATSNTLLQTIVEDNKRGRVMSIYAMAFVGTAPFGSFLAGSLAQKIGSPATMMIGGISCIIGSLIFTLKFSRFKRAIQPVFEKMGYLKSDNNS